MGLPFDRVTHDQVVDRIADALARGRGGWVITPNLDILRQARRQPDHHELFADANLVLADGMPLVWASRLQGTPLPERVAGSDLVWSVTERAARLGASVFLLGGPRGAAEGAADRLRDRSPGLTVAGTLSPPMGFERDPAQMARVVDAVRRANPDIVLVGLGFPKQEEVIRVLRPGCPRTWFLGIGISLAFVSGDVRRAPRWMQKSGLEWVHRLVQEPTRLARRYIVYGVPFAMALFARAAQRRWQERPRRVRRALERRRVAVDQPVLGPARNRPLLSPPALALASDAANITVAPASATVRFTPDGGPAPVSPRLPALAPAPLSPVSAAELSSTS
jgi:N-acetylglucosaminyldiphosphoundecaprenol N-acetyl-beta-D-mannosaminyltransferase